MSSVSVVSATDRFRLAMIADRIEYDVFGRRIIVEATDEGWTAFHAGTDGKRRPADIRIPPHLDRTEIAGYLDDLFHEWASAEHPVVRML